MLAESMLHPISFDANRHVPLGSVKSKEVLEPIAVLKGGMIFKEPPPVSVKM